MSLPLEVRLATAVLVLAAVGLGVALYLRRRRRAAEALGDAHLVPWIADVDLRRRPWLRIGLVLAAALAIAAALVDPSLGGPANSRSGPVVLLLDASASMLAEEGGRTRLATQRDQARRLADALADVPVGIVAFSGDAFALTPPTRDSRAVAMYLEMLDPTIVSQSGSGLGDAIRQGLALLAAGQGAAGTLVLMTDGDETEDRAAALEAAALAGRAGIPLHVVGVGTEGGAAVPAIDLATGTASGVLRDAEGAPLISRLDEALLREIAGRGGGSYLAPAIDPISGLVDRLRPDRRMPNGEGDVPAYVWLAGAAFLLLLLDSLLAHREARG